ncbi:hypothetical protein HYC85_014538 [Camellia sinensis]|uniref:Transmembrane 9 superfamily member n=1 Tax=Camellia sinensis TaxID=4442 RepID=A0A7J7H8I6_CAMSI|nr:hypothetical protein HYC85_014538 [Camellia sinensis]
MDWFPVGCTPPDGNEDYVINHLKFRVLVHEYEGAGVQIIGTGEEGMGVISQADKEAASGYEIVGFEVVPCSVKHDPDVLSKPHMYDNISVIAIPGLPLLYSDPDMCPFWAFRSSGYSCARAEIVHFQYFCASAKLLQMWFLRSSGFVDARAGGARASLLALERVVLSGRKFWEVGICARADRFGARADVFYSCVLALERALLRSSVSRFLFLELERRVLRSSGPYVYVLSAGSDIRWPSRWDAYLKMKGARVDWFLILNSLMVILFFAGIVFVIFLQTVRRDLARYEEWDKEAQAQMNEELSGWKLVVGDVFREPNHSKLLYVMIGDGVQISRMAIVTIVFVAFGFISPASRGMLLTGMIILYLFLGTFAGYAGVRLWRTIKGTSDGWRSVAWSVA